MKIRTLALAGMALLAATEAFAAAPAPRPSCLRNIDIYNYNALSDKTLIVESTRHDKWKLTLIGMCWNMNMKEHIVFRTIGGSELTCLSKGDQVIVRDFGMRQTCSITSIGPYTKQMEAADKAAKAAKSGNSDKNQSY